ncbi:signal peptidase I [Litoribrevibacter euphylliae]|uniref:Signal peptidase I n=1 Tax=Litoribrevibacter euphylliae TaxID=1834034 RepID=A0ABV7HH80_9GAMM
MTSETHASSPDWKPNTWVAGLLGFLTPYIAMFYVSKRWLAIPYFVAALIAGVLSSKHDSSIAIFSVMLIGAIHAAWLAKKSTSRVQSWTNRIWGLALILLCIWAPWFGMRMFVMDFFVVPAASMAPTINVKDIILTTKTDFIPNLFTDEAHTGSSLSDSNKPKRGDIVTFKYPVKPEITFLKRIIGLPGDTITISDKKVSVNGQPLPLQKINEDIRITTWREQNGEAVYLINVANSLPRDQAEGSWTVPENAYFVMGDNRDNSNDSRFWGFVPEHYLSGKVMAVF